MRVRVYRLGREGYPKPKPPMFFADLERAVKLYEKADRTDTSAASKANALLHAHYSDQLHQRKMD